MAEDAKGIAVAVKAAHEGHEALCAVRQGEIKADLQEIKDWMKWVFRGIAVAVVGLVYNALRAKGIL